MKRTLISILFFTICFTASLSAQSYKDVRDFNNTFEINVHKEGETSMAKCQAVRLNKTWFITAAHCVKPVCDSACTVEARLLLKDKYEVDISVNHTPSNPAVFVHERTTLNKNEAGYDIALINFKPEQSKFLYKDNEEHMLLPKDVFTPKAPFTSREYSEAAEGTNSPTILLLKAETPKMLNRVISVASIWDGSVSVLRSNDLVIFAPKQHYIFTPNFGIRNGISGSGVMTNKGELVGIVSSTAEIVRTYSDGVTNERKEYNFSFMATFDEYVINFLKRNIGNINYDISDTDTLKVVPEEYKNMANSIDNTVS